MAKIKARDLHNGHGKPEREAIRSLQSSEILTSMIGKSGGAIVKNQILHDNKENKTL